MNELKVDGLRATIEACRQIVSEWDTILADLGMLASQHAESQTRLEELERENSELRKTCDGLSAEYAAVTQALAKLEAAHRMQLVQHDGVETDLCNLQQEYESLCQERQWAREMLQAVLGRLKP